MISGTVAIDVTSKSTIKHTTRRLSRQEVVSAALVGCRPNAGSEPRAMAGLGRDKGRCLGVRFLIPPVEHRTCGFHRIRRSTLGPSPWSCHEASVSISAASTGLHPCLIPLHQHTRETSRGQLTRSRGTLFADYALYSVLPKARGLRHGDLPRVDGVTVFRLLGPIRLSVRAWAFR